ncbi:uncharacterized protein LOC125943625 [Dermacentor silvarum]|uniref:uncharacterized protein LOC125943625 n=1 Tax=Dermacentor silvarum TaxID=543639 RepID=UPI0021013964|nr:uncharacterized protein LOC125943625 [Dermacentor silvarum]
MCKSKPRQENVAHCEESASVSEDYGQFLLHLRESSRGLVGPIWRTLQWKGVPVKMQVDTGSPVSIVTWPTYAQHRHRWPMLEKSSFQLSCFLGRLPVKGQLEVPVTYAGKTVNATLVVLGCSGPNLCGRDIIQAFQLTGPSAQRGRQRRCTSPQTFARRTRMVQELWGRRQLETRSDTEYQGIPPEHGQDGRW